MIDFTSFNIYLLAPVLIILVILLFAIKAFKLPEDYYKSMQIREAMLKRRAEKADIEKLEHLRALAAMEEELDEDEDEEL